MNARNAIAAIEKSGILLVYPIDNRPEPRSLWSAFFPRTPMRWEWDDEGDDRVARLWHLRAELSASGKVVYAKWFRGRATFFSRELFVACLAALNAGESLPQLASASRSLDDDARRILEALSLDSPLSTKQLKLAVDLRGRQYERAYERALKQLWSKLLIVGYGEIDDGAFPSLALGSARLLFEDLWEEAGQLAAHEAWRRIEAVLPEKSLFLRHLRKGLPAELAR